MMAQLVSLRAALLQGGDWACLAFERLAGDEKSRRSPTLASIWARRRSSGSVPRAAVAISTELQRQLSATPLPRLPAKLLDLRREAAMHGDQRSHHYGRLLALLWDDPEHLLPVARPAPRTRPRERVIL